MRRYGRTVGCGVGGLEAGFVIGERPHHHQIARRLEAFPRCAQGMRQGRLSLDQVGVIAARAGEGSDEHYAQLARVATVNQLRTAVNCEPRPEPDSGPQPPPSITEDLRRGVSCWRITLGHLDAAKFDAALASHRDALIAEYKHDHGDRDRESDIASPLPGTLEAFLRLVETGWDSEATRRPHGQHTTVVVHLDVDSGPRRCIWSAAYRDRTPVPDL